MTTGPIDPDPKVRKPRSLTTRGDGWVADNTTHKAFRVNGADPADLPSQGRVHHKPKQICKRSPDHEHHYEVVSERVYWRSEHMVDQCSYCGKKKGFGFTVWIVKPDWIKKLEERRRGW